MTFHVTGYKARAFNEVCMVRNGEACIFPKRSISGFQTFAEINFSEYAMVNRAQFPSYESNLAISMIQRLGSHNHFDAHKAAFIEGLSTPSPSIFLPYYINVNEALESRAVLYDASGDAIEGERLKQYSARLNSDCWVHLNAAFPKGEGFLGLDLDVIEGFDEEGNPEFSISPLEDCLEEHCWADLESLNSQGFPTRKSKIEEYIPGKVIYFGRPYEDSVARFSADSIGAFLLCNGGPLVSDSRLGVFLCAEGAQIKLGI